MRLSHYSGGTLSQEYTDLGIPTPCPGPDLGLGGGSSRSRSMKCSLFLQSLAQRKILVAPASDAPLHGHDICVAHILWQEAMLGS